MRDPQTIRGEGEFEPIALFALDQLAVEEIVGNMPVIGSRSLRMKPIAEVGGGGVEVAAQAIAGEGGNAVVIQTQMKIMEKGPACAPRGHPPDGARG